ncbi:formylglycine-generating enzyme family protein [Galbibacter sp.]|jgi:formylglycine-generating enzyme required for sulfatase activity|uniref:formylglycine-generating enzyme family protein n=1 Tax=Galbibacter sp. TaxID=2918471 RepID=UPI003A929D3A
MKITLLITALSCLLVSCKNTKESPSNASKSSKALTTQIEVVKKKPTDIITPEGMVWIPGGNFTQGARQGDSFALEHEKPAHPVAVDGFFMDITEVTNDEFSEFVNQTGYITIAEREIDWQDLKKQLPAGTPKPHDSILQPGSLVFKKTATSVPNLYDFSQWWEWKIGANWKHPKGPESTIEGKGNYPVVHIAFADAIAYCEWAGRKLPTEAQWELAANAGMRNKRYTWGDNETELNANANTWTGEFPTQNDQIDGFENKAPVKSFPPNAYGLYEIAGNVWEWTQDWYHVDYYKQLLENGVVHNPNGAEKAFNPNNPYSQEKIIKGGSFLCSDTYCASYRISARMATSTDSGQAHLGFRTIATAEMLKEHTTKPTTSL